MTQIKNYFSKARVETFSDGVFAIIVTLLVLEIKVPHIELETSSGELFKALIKLLPKFISWIISFFTVCIIWVNHHRLFKMFHIFNQGLFWWNAVVLMWVSFIPFPTALLGDYPENSTSFLLYGAVMIAVTMSFAFMRIYVSHRDGLLHPDINRETFKKGTKFSILFGAIPYLIGALAVYIHPYISFVIFIAIAIYFILPHSTEEIEILEKKQH